MHINYFIKENSVSTHKNSKIGKREGRLHQKYTHKNTGKKYLRRKPEKYIGDEMLIVENKFPNKKRRAKIKKNGLSKLIVYNYRFIIDHFKIQSKLN